VNAYDLPGPVVGARAPIARSGKIVDMRRMGRLLLATILSAAAYLALRRLQRPSYSRWGATDEEGRRTCPATSLSPPLAHTRRGP
jgi:hypothetical protein